VFSGAIKCNPKTKGASEEEVEERIAAYLRTAGDKEGGRSERMNIGPQE